MPPNRLIDLTGQQFGNWTVLRRGTRAYGATRWWCRCSCGAEAELIGANLKRGTAGQACRECRAKARKATRA